MSNAEYEPWMALLIAITQNVTVAKALSAVAGRRTLKRLSWAELLQAYKDDVQRDYERRRAISQSEKIRNYQREYRRAHPITEEQRAKRVVYMAEYRRRNKQNAKVQRRPSCKSVC